jgi:hypothetical protein
MDINITPTAKVEWAGYTWYRLAEYDNTTRIHP